MAGGRINRVGERRSDPFSAEVAVSWMSDAACLGDLKIQSLFFPVVRGDHTKEAKAICETCLAQDQCLQFALVNRIDHGVWGGKSERERRRMRGLRT